MLNGLHSSPELQRDSGWSFTAFHKIDICDNVNLISIRGDYVTYLFLKLQGGPIPIHLETGQVLR